MFGGSTVLNRKGQGLTEYGIILLLVLMIGGLVWFHSDVKGQLSTIYAAIETDLKSIADDKATENYDTNETTTVAGTLVHFTSLSVVGQQQNYRVAWFLDSSGQRVYFPYRDTNGLHDTADLQGVHQGWTFKDVQFDPDGGLTTYFKGADGSYYKITDYEDKDTVLTKYDGTPTSHVRVPYN